MNKMGELKRPAFEVLRDNSFELYPIVSLMDAKGETDSKCSVKCEGEESRKGHFTCDSKVLQERINCLEKLLDEKERTIQILMKK